MSSTTQDTLWKTFLAIAGNGGELAGFFGDMVVPARYDNEDGVSTASNDGQYVGVDRADRIGIWPRPGPPW